MSRCILCDCSQSADSIYHNGLVGTYYTQSDPKFSKALGGFVCIDCRESILDQRQDWRIIDGELEFNHFEEEAQHHPGCTEKPTG